MHGLTGGSWKRNKDRTRATEMKDTRGNLAVTSGSETYRRCALPRQLSTLLPRRNRHKRPIQAAPHQVNNLTMPAEAKRRRWRVVVQSGADRGLLLLGPSDTPLSAYHP